MPIANEQTPQNLIEILQNCSLFAGVDEKTCKELIPHLEEITIKHGEILFEQGDPSDCAYILVEGQLAAHLLSKKNKTELVGIIEPGETVGEMGALSNHRRSLTVNAIVNSKLLKLKREKFEAFNKEHPEFAAHITNLVISRSQKTIRLISKKKFHRHILIIPGNENAPIKHVAEKLKLYLKDNNAYVFLDKLTEETSLDDVVRIIERENKNGIFILNENIVKNLKHRMKHFTHAFVVVDGDTYDIFSDSALKMLSTSYTPFVSQYELILVHQDNVAQPKNTKHWLKQADFSLHHHIHLNDESDYQRLLRFMQGTAIGVVMGGGGQKGWADMGSLKAILDAGIPIDAIGGTSVGAVAAACYAKNLNYEKAIAVFDRNSRASRHFFALNKLSFPLVSIITSKNQTNALIYDFQDTQIEDLWIPFFANTTNLTTHQEISHREGLLWERLRASAALPGIAPPVVIHGELHYDGGLMNNLPVDRMRSMLGKEGIVIAISLASIANIPKNYNFPPIVSFWMGLAKRLKIAYKDYKFPPFFNTFINALLVGASSKEKANQLEADVLIMPDLSKFHLLKLDDQMVEELKAISYKATQEALRANEHLFK